MTTALVGGESTELLPAYQVGKSFVGQGARCGILSHTWTTSTCTVEFHGNPVTGAWEQVEDDQA
jgi:hypothetical protein